MVPVKDEEASIGRVRGARGRDPLRPSCRTTLAEILFVDDGSTDGTLAAIERERHGRPAGARGLAVAQLRQGGGACPPGWTMRAGLAVIPIDVDLQDPPELIGPMLERWRERATTSSMVYAGSAPATAPPSAWTAHWFYKIHNAMTRAKIPEHAGDFRLLDRARRGRHPRAARSATAS